MPPSLLVRASRLYYLERKTQAQIARALRISRPGVSRLLERARRQGVVEIRVRDGGQAAGAADLAARLGLREVLVADADGAGAVGSLAADYFERSVRQRDIVGLTAGTTLAAFVRSVRPEQPLGLEIVPLVGSLWETGQDFDCSFLCQELRRAAGGTHRVLSVPAVVRDASLARALRSEPRVRSVLARYRSLHCAFLGVGLAEEGHPVVEAAAASGRSGRGRAWLPREAAASIGCVFYDRTGKPCPTPFDSRVIGISHAELASVPLKVGLAAGAGKADAVLALARARAVDVLIADPDLAGRLVTAAAKE